MYDIAANLQTPNFLASFVQGNEAAQTAKMNRLKVGEAERAAALADKRGKYGNLYSAGVTPEKPFSARGFYEAALQDSAAAGDGEQAMQYTKALTDHDAALAKLSREQMESAKVGLEFQGQLLGGVRDQATWDAALGQAKQAGMDVSRFPTQYDPAVVSTLTSQALGAKDRLDQVWKQRQYDFDQEKFGETKRSNRVAEGQRSQQIGISAAQLSKPQLVQTGDGFEWVRPGQAPQGLPKGVTGKGNESASNTLKVIGAAEALIPSSTGSYGGAALDLANRVIGKSTSGANNAAKLKVLEAKLVQAMPKMSGPQSDRDVQLYREAAGLIGDPTLPNSQKMAAMATLREITANYGGTLAPPEPPKPGILEDGYLFRGGNPTDPKNWSKTR